MVNSFKKTKQKKNKKKKMYNYVFYFPHVDNITDLNIINY